MENNEFKIEIQTVERIKERMREQQLRDLEAENARLRAEADRAKSVVDYGVMVGVLPDPEEEEN